MERKERIEQLVKKIRREKEDKEGKQKVKTSKPLVTKKPATEKRRKMYIGWLHRSSNESRYKQIKTKDGGGVRDFSYVDDDQITVESLKTKAIKLFFPGGVSKYGSLKDMQLALGNYAQETITSFRDIDDKQCTFQEYLKSRGLFASKCPVYLMSTLTCGDKNPDLVTASLEQAEQASASTSGVFMGCSRTQLSEEFDSLQMTTSTPNKLVSRGQTPLYGLALKEDEGTVCTVENVGDHRLLITYESVTESSYSEVTIKSVIFTREQCYETQCFSEPFTRDTALDEYDPLENGFTVVGISKGETCFLDKIYGSMQLSNDQGDEEFKYDFPQVALENSSGLILHPPSEIWGYDGNQLIIGVVASCHMDNHARYVWYRNGSKLKEGRTLCCLPVNEPGSYSVEVLHGEQREVSETVVIRPLSELAAKVRSEATTEGKGDEAAQQLKQTDSLAVPVVDKEETVFSSKDEIGRGSFGVVYKASWAGTNVAVKVMKIRNAKRLQSIIETEVRVHAMIRHPNIVQIMAVSILKNSIYIVAEYIEGLNLDELLFGEDEDAKTFTIESCDKVNVGKQICQAVAYLHNLKPAVLHRDIKPANVLVAKESHVTKLCDMGLSKVKSAQSLSQTGTATAAIPGSPSYMAPECLLEKKKATTYSDVWSLACTLVELFTERDCWADLMELENKAIAREDRDDTAPEINSLIALMKRKESPRVLGMLPNTIDASVQHILADCFQYDIAQRPRAIDIVNALLQ